MGRRRLYHTKKEKQEAIKRYRKNYFKDKKHMYVKAQTLIDLNEYVERNGLMSYDEAINILLKNT